MTITAVTGAGRAAALRAPVTAALGAAAAVGYVGLVDPNEPGHYPTCPFLALTGLYCPGCGALRAVHAMAQGDVATAAGLNVLTVAAVLPLAVIWVLWAVRSWRGEPRRRVAPPALLWALLAVVLVFAVLRNLPVGAGLAP